MRLLGMSPIPKIRVRSEKRTTAPPEEWRHTDPPPGTDMMPIPLPRIPGAAIPDPDLANAIRVFLHDLFPKVRVPKKAVRLIASAIQLKELM